MRPETWDTTFDPLRALSLARTALDDPAALHDPPRWDGNLSYSSHSMRDADLHKYAVHRIDEVIGALMYEPANDARAEARWALTHLGRLVNDVAQGLDADEVERDAAGRINDALDALDEAIAVLDEPYEDEPESPSGPWFTRWAWRLVGW